MRAAGHKPDVSIVQFHRVAMSCRTGPLQELESDRSPRRTRLLDRGNSFTPDEWPFAKFDGPSEAGFNWTDVVREFVPVQWHARFEPKCIARAESNRLGTPPPGG